MPFPSSAGTSGQRLGVTAAVVFLLAAVLPWESTSAAGAVVPPAVAAALSATALLLVLGSAIRRPVSAALGVAWTVGAVALLALGAGPAATTLLAALAGAVALGAGVVPARPRSAPAETGLPIAMPRARAWDEEPSVAAPARDEVDW